jgi:hypothetical protein
MWDSRVFEKLGRRRVSGIIKQIHECEGKYGSYYQIQISEQVGRDILVTFPSQMRKQLLENDLTHDDVIGERVSIRCTVHPLNSTDEQYHHGSYPDGRCEFVDIKMHKDYTRRWAIEYSIDYKPVSLFLDGKYKGAYIAARWNDCNRFDVLINGMVFEICLYADHASIIWNYESMTYLNQNPRQQNFEFNRYENLEQVMQALNSRLKFCKVHPLPSKVHNV